jgi:hypothetical protein
MYKFLIALIFVPALLFAGSFQNRYFQDQENCLNLKYISSKKIADSWYHAFYGQVSEDNDYKYYLYIFRNTNSEPEKFRLTKLNFIEEIQPENFDFTVYKEKQVSFYYKTTKNNFYFYTGLKVGDKINSDLFTKFKNNKDSFLYYSQKDNSVINTPNTIPGEGNITSLSSNICYAFKYGYDNKRQLTIKIASKDKYYIYFIKPPYQFQSFENKCSMFDASEKQLPIFDSIESDLAYRIEDYNFQRICNKLSRDYKDTITGMFKQKDNREQVLSKFFCSSAALASLPDMKQMLSYNLNYYYNDSTDLFVPCEFEPDNSLFELSNFIDNSFEESYHSWFNIKNYSQDENYFLEFQKNYNISDAKNDNYLDSYKTLLDFSYTNSPYFTNIKMNQTSFLKAADSLIEATFMKYYTVLSNFSYGVTNLENLETRYQNQFYDTLLDTSHNITKFYDSLIDNIPQVLVNYHNYLDSVKSLGYLFPDKEKAKTNNIINDFTGYSFKFISGYYETMDEKLAEEYSSSDECCFDSLSGSLINNKFLNQCRSIVSNSAAYMDKHSLFQAKLSNLLDNRALSDYLKNNEDIQEFCQSNQFYFIDKEQFLKSLIRKNFMDKKSGKSSLMVQMKIWNPIHFYTNYFTNTAVYSRNLPDEKLKSISDIRLIFPDFVDRIKNVSLFYNELNKNLNLKKKNEQAIENKIVLDVKNNLKGYFDIKNYFNETLSELKMKYTNAIQDFSKITSNRNYFQDRIRLLSGNYKEFDTEAGKFFYSDDYQKVLNQLIHNTLFNSLFSKYTMNKQNDFVHFEAEYNKVYQQMTIDFNNLMKQYHADRSRLPDFKKYDGYFGTNTAGDWPVLLTKNKKKTLKEYMEDKMIAVLTNTADLSDLLDMNRLKEAVRSSLKRKNSDIDLSGMLISESHQNNINIRVGELGYNIKGNNLVYEIKKIRAIDNNLWVIFSTTTKIPESYVDRIDLTRTNTLNIPDSFNKMLSENKLIRGDYYDDVVMLYPGRVLLYKHGSTDNSTKNENNLKRLVVLDYSGGKNIIRNDAASQLKQLNHLFNEKIDAIYSFYDKNKKETELIINMRNNILFLKYNKNGFVPSDEEDCLLNNSFIITDELDKFVFKYKLTGY